MKHRTSWIDIAKCFAIFLVVLGHTIEEENFVLRFIYLFHVPFFFFLSGFTYYYHQDQISYIDNRVKRLYFPYLGVGLVSIFVYLLMGGIIGSGIGFNWPSISECLLGLVYGNVSVYNMMWNRPLWFLLALLIAEIIMNLSGLIKNKWLRILFLSVLFVFGYFLSLNRIFLPLQTETALSMLFWIMLGYYLKRYMGSIEEKPKGLLALGAVLLIVIGTAVGFYNGTISVMVDLYGKYVPLYMFSSFCLSLAFVLISMIIGKSRILEYVGRETLVILLWHKFPIEFFQRLCPVIKDLLVSPNTVVAMLTALFVAVLSMVLSILLKVIYLEAKKRIIPEKT